MLAVYAVLVAEMPLGAAGIRAGLQAPPTSDIQRITAVLTTLADMTQLQSSRGCTCQEQEAFHARLIRGIIAAPMSIRRTPIALTVIAVLAALVVAEAGQRPGGRPGRGGGGTGPARGGAQGNAADTLTRTIAADAGSPNAPVLFDIGVHVEPFGATVSPLAERPSRPGGAGRAGSGARGTPSFHDPDFFERHVDGIRQVAAIAERFGGRLTVQVQTPFTTVAAERRQRVLADLEAKGHQIALHFHEDAHLGPRPETLAPERWTAVLREEADAIAKAGVRTPVTYWSGGNLYPHVLQAASAAGFKFNSDFKNPRTQDTPASLLGLFPWRPAGGASESDVTAFARHDPKGPIVFLPEGAYLTTDFASMRRSADGDYDYFDSVTASLEQSLRTARTDRVNVFHVTVHSNEFRGQAGRPFAVIEQWLAKVVDPLVKARKVKWATYAQMAAAFETWEGQNPGVDPRSASAAAAAVPAPATIPARPAPAAAPGYITFAINVHDWKHVDDSADTLIRAADLFRKYGVRGDFYMTAPVVAQYARSRRDVIEKLKSTGMTISYHVRAPHPLYEGFDGILEGLDEQRLRATLEDYETYALDLKTGGLDRGSPGGYRYVASVFGTPPVVIGTAAQTDRRIRAAAQDVYKRLGARMVIVYHERGGNPARPFETAASGLLVRPSHFSITRWPGPGETAEAFWWNRLRGRGAAAFDPARKLEQEMRNWTAADPPFATALIHENNFYRFGAEGWTLSYYGDVTRQRVLRPPFNLNAPDPSRVRPRDEQRAIWEAYENLVKYAAAHLRVVTSADIVRMAGPR
jgi:peptidoglycan/xylan/chitin deacetylase (PgdA/CDA1 family)